MIYERIELVPISEKNKNLMHKIYNALGDIASLVQGSYNLQGYYGLRATDKDTQYQIHLEKNSRIRVMSRPKNNTDSSFVVIKDFDIESGSTTDHENSSDNAITALIANILAEKNILKLM